MKNLNASPWALLFLFACGYFSTTADAFEYFCPRADMTLLQPYGNDDGPLIKLEGSSGLALSFPRTIADLNRGPDDVSQLEIELRDCSTPTFVCKKVSQVYANEKPREYILALPRKIEILKEYDFGTLHMVTRFAANSSNKRDPIAQVTIWQKIEGHVFPIELTVKSKQGVIYWDGLKLSAGESGAGELCVLQFGQGLFSSVKISALRSVGE
jgi:hypothetical protein